ncbi:MAG: DsbA family protein [Solirubrobacteraceae bacterium]
MASRKEQKDQARAARLAEEQARAARKQRSRRFQIFGGTGIIAIAIVVVVIVALGSGGSTKTSGLKQGSAATAVYKQVNTLLKGIPESGETLGYPSAKVTLTYFGDLQCPVCADFARGLGGSGFPEFIARDVRARIAKVQYKSLCTATCNDFSQSLFNRQQADALAAGKQGLMWYYVELFYHQQGAEGSPYVNTAFLDKLARQIPQLNYTKWQNATGSPALRAQISHDEALAQNKYNFQATPSFVISGPKGSSALGAGILTYAQLTQAVKAVSS